MRRSVTYAILFLLLLPFAALATEPFSFAIVGDTHIGQTETVYATILRLIDREKVQAIVHTGDAITEPGSESEWERFLQLTGNSRPLYIAPGNHDIKGRKSLTTYSRILGKPPYYSAVHDDTLLILLNSEIPGQEGRITGQQLEWLKAELKRPFTYHIVFLHRPLFTTLLGTGYGLDRFKAERDRLHELFKEYNVPLVVAGHEHHYNRSEHDGIIYVIAGGGGARLLTFFEEYGGFFHYVIAKKRNGGYVLRVHDLKGNIRDEFSIKR
jgi:predicted phosphodiesterase